MTYTDFFYNELGGVAIEANEVYRTLKQTGEYQIVNGEFDESKEYHFYLIPDDLKFKNTSEVVVWFLDSDALFWACEPIEFEWDEKRVEFAS